MTLKSIAVLIGTVWFCGTGAMAVSSAFPPENIAAARKAFDFIVGIDGDFKTALASASKTASSGNRYHIFFPTGAYDIGTLTGDNNQMTTVSTSGISFIGQSKDSAIIYNRSVQEGIGITATLYFNKADDLYLQDLTILNKASYGNPSTYAVTGRHVAVMEQGNDIVYKNVKLLSTQDTYYTKGDRSYWENGEIHGTTDFICGGGDIFFNKCLLFIEKESYITAPATSTSWGYVFMDCIIDGTVNSFNLGRPWNNSPKCVYLNTVMKKQPTAAGWGDPMNVVPSLFAEYNSVTASGTPVNLGGRRTTYSKNGTTVTLNPVLSAEQAAKYTVENVMKGNDDWQPRNLSRQTGAPEARMEGTRLTWNDDEKASCWMVFKDNTYYRCVTSNGCEIDLDAKASYTVRAANAMGGLGPVSNAVGGAVSSHAAPERRTDPGPKCIIDQARNVLCIRVSITRYCRAALFSLSGVQVLPECFTAGSGTVDLEMPIRGIGSGVCVVKAEVDGTVDFIRVHNTH